MLFVYTVCLIVLYFPVEGFVFALNSSLTHAMLTSLCFIFTFALWSPCTTFPLRFPLQQSNVHVKPPFLCASYYTQTLTAKRHTCPSQCYTQTWHKEMEDKTFPSSSWTGSQSLCCEVPAAVPSQAAEPHLTTYRRYISVSEVYIHLKGG